MEASQEEDRIDPSVEIVVLNWNRFADTLDCLRALDDLDYDRVHVFVVDNGSTDGSEAEIRAARPDVELVQSGANLGYAGGNNIGIRNAIERGAEFVWILNNDARPRPSALTEFVACLRADPRIGVLASRAQSPAGDEEARLAFATIDARALSYFGNDGEIGCTGAEATGTFHEAAIVSGPSLLFRTAALEQVGSFDESYFHFFEEVDLVERLRRAGFVAGLACRAVVEHEWGSSLGHESPQALYYLTRNQLLYRKKLFGEHPLRIVVRSPVWRPRRVFSVRHFARGDFRFVRVYGQALVDALRGCGGRRDFGPRYATNARV
jgi:GT2 family glycosyltransferase